MNYSIQSIIPILVAAACAAVIVSVLLSWLLGRRPSSEALLRDFGSPQAQAAVADARSGR
ncbi:MAG: hypothetical protein R6V75_00230 [Bacteroidales bacterium]